MTPSAMPGVPGAPTSGRGAGALRDRPDFGTASWRTWGCRMALVVADAGRMDRALDLCHGLLDRVDRACSRFRADSDLVRANARAGHWVSVDPLLVGAVQEALRVAEVTDGLVVPTLGGVLAALGYDRDLPLVRAGTAPTDLPVVRPVPADGWRAVGVDPAGALRVPRGVELDLGAVGKAWAADLVADELSKEVATGLVVSLGGDVAVRNRPGDELAWPVDVAEDPAGPGEERVTVRHGGLATSSTTRRRWRRGDATVHHLIDPRTGAPVEAVWRTATVCAATCSDANAASTAAVVLREEAPAWLERHRLPARLVGHDGRVLRLAGWPDPVPADLAG